MRRTAAHFERLLLEGTGASTVLGTVTRRLGDGLRVAVLGLGEAGGRIASDLAASGADVRGWDPDSSRQLDGVRLGASASATVGEVDLVLSVNSQAAALTAARECLPGLAGGTLYADLNSASPRVKIEVADIVGRVGALFADVALMSPVPGHGLRTPMLASGAGAIAFAERLRALGATVDVVGVEPGAAATRKLLRSVFMKGLAAATLESLHAADAAGCEPWLRSEISSVLTSADASLLDRLVEGSRLHAARRVEEMAAAGELLRDLGVVPRVTAAAAATLAELASKPPEKVS